MSVGKLLRRHETRFFEQGQIAVGIVVALQTGITVPVPHTAEVTGVIDVAETGEAGFPDVNARRDAGPPAAEDGDIDFLADRFTGNDRRVGVRFVSTGEVVHRTAILLLAFLANAPVALLAILCLQRWDIDLFGRGQTRRCGVYHFQTPGAPALDADDSGSKFIINSIVD